MINGKFILCWGKRSSATNYKQVLFDILRWTDSSCLRFTFSKSFLSLVRSLSILQHLFIISHSTEYVLGLRKQPNKTAWLSSSSYKMSNSCRASWLERFFPCDWMWKALALSFVLPSSQSIARQQRYFFSGSFRIFKRAGGRGGRQKGTIFHSHAELTEKSSLRK